MEPELALFDAGRETAIRPARLQEIHALRIPIVAD
jgi:hypothetical protein